MTTTQLVGKNITATEGVEVNVPIFDNENKNIVSFYLAICQMP